MVKLYGFCLSIAYIARRRHPYIESLPTLWYNEQYKNYNSRVVSMHAWFLNLTTAAHYKFIQEQINYDLNKEQNNYN